ncbi:hypothetical protein ACFW1A_28405 [Kitasatospora sp. NPDC058965]|uniref:hypothetical protein n=1 Tax=Kitasatospora sp. NPDC058965 TaxID=3346682 RepID=UPI0036970AEC
MAVLSGDMAQAVVETAVTQRRRLESGSSRRTGLVVLGALAVLGLVLALAVAGGQSDAAPTCDGQTMSVHDICQIFSTHGGGGSYGYQEMIDRRESQHQIWRVVGFGVTALSLLLMVPVFRRLDPSRPWGNPVAETCPRCGGPNLRERSTTHSVTRGRTTHRFTGIVTLCAPTCGFTAIRRP